MNAVQWAQNDHNRTSSAFGSGVQQVSYQELCNSLEEHQGPDVQSIISLTSLLRVISLTVLADSIYNILIFFAEKL